jgi:hypothetical protein
MRKMVLTATLAAFGGFCLAAATSFASLRYQVWKASSEPFKMGYVIGYLDAVGLSQRRDARASVTIPPGKDYAPWVRGVDKYFADPANQDRSIPDAILQVGTDFRVELLREAGRQRMGLPPSPKPTGPQP